MTSNGRKTSIVLFQGAIKEQNPFVGLEASGMCYRLSNLCQVSCRPQQSGSPDHLGLALEWIDQFELEFLTRATFEGDSSAEFPSHRLGPSAKTRIC
jgi:hypothetical protein